MPLFIVIGRDGEGVAEKRAAVRDAHLANLQLIAEAGQACGSVLVLEFPSLAEARGFAESDPYATEGVLPIPGSLRNPPGLPRKPGAGTDSSSFKFASLKNLQT